MAALRMSETSDNPHHSQGLRKSAGERLKRARELKGFSQKDVASALNLMVSHVRAIELNRYDASREGDHFDSYLRSYSELVHLNPEQIVDLYREHSRQQNEVAAAVALGGEEDEVTGISKLFLATVCLALAAWLAYRFWPAPASLDALDPATIDTLVEREGNQAGDAVRKRNAIDSIERQAKGGAGAEDPVVIAVPSSVGNGEDAPLQPRVVERPELPVAGAATAALAETATGEAEQEAEQDDTLAATEESAESLRSALAQKLDENQIDSAGAAARESSIVEKQLAVAAREAQMAPAEQANTGNELLAEQQVVAMVQGIKPAAGSPDVTTGLAFSFSDDCWLDVRDAANKSIFNGVKKSGESLNLQGQAPFDVLIGRSKAVTHMSYNGQSIAVRLHKYSDSTRLIVGGEAALALDVTGKQRPAADEAIAVADVAADADTAAAEIASATATTEVATDPDIGSEEISGSAAAQLDENVQNIQPAAGNSPAVVRPLPAPQPKTSAEQAQEIAALNLADGQQVSVSADEMALRLPASIPGNEPTPGVAVDELQFQFAAECWVEVYDADKRPLFMNTGAAGETLKLSGSAPFEVRLGNSRAVRLNYNGQPVQIEHHSSISSSELIVGTR